MRRVAERKRTKAEERAFAELQDVLAELEMIRVDMTLRYQRLRFDNMPLDWASVEVANPVRPKKTRITAAYDADVARFFQSMGNGYQARMNAVLRCYMLGILSRELSCKKNEDWMGREM